LCVRGPNTVGRAVQTDPTLLRQKEFCQREMFSWLKNLTGFKLCATTPYNAQQGVERTLHCWELLAVADPGEGPRGPAPPLFLDQTEARRAEKIFLGDRPLPPYLGV